jgi:hydroxymethylpyrimidine/phosphomethylpyrimidine kinase
MVGSADNARVLARFISDNRLTFVLDPVMVSSSGFELADRPTVAAIMSELIPRSYLVTPNAAEAAALTGQPVDTPAQAEQAAIALHDQMGATNVVVTGGHLKGAGRIVDTLYNGDNIHVFERERIDGSARGTGCAFATAAAIGLARGLELEAALGIAGDLAAEMIAGSQKVGGGRPQFIFR